MEKPYIFDGIVYTSNKRSRTPSPTLFITNRFKRLKINKFSNIKLIQPDNKRQELLPVFSISKKIKTN
jgi:hypothetical protein